MIRNRAIVSALLLSPLASLVQANEIRAMTAAASHVAAHEKAIVEERRELLALPNVATSDSDIRRGMELYAALLAAAGSGW
jgi:hypothetical protein